MNVSIVWRILTPFGEGDPPFACEGLLAKLFWRRLGSTGYPVLRRHLPPHSHKPRVLSCCKAFRRMAFPTLKRRQLGEQLPDTIVDPVAKRRVRNFREALRRDNKTP